MIRFRPATLRWMIPLSYRRQAVSRINAKYIIFRQTVILSPLCVFDPMKVWWHVKQISNQWQLPWSWWEWQPGSFAVTMVRVECEAYHDQSSEGICERKHLEPIVISGKTTWIHYRKFEIYINALHVRSICAKYNYGWLAKQALRNQAGGDLLPTE